MAVGFGVALGRLLRAIECRPFKLVVNRVVFVAKQVILVKLFRFLKLALFVGTYAHFCYTALIFALMEFFLLKIEYLISDFFSLTTILTHPFRASRLENIP